MVLGIDQLNVCGTYTPAPRLARTTMGHKGPGVHVSRIHICLFSEEVTLYTAADRGRVQESSSSWHSLLYLRCQEQRASPLVSGALLLLLALGAFPRASPLVSGVTSDRHLVLLLW